MNRSQACQRASWLVLVFCLQGCGGDAFDFAGPSSNDAGDERGAIAVVDGAAPWDASTPLDAGDELATDSRPETAVAIVLDAGDERDAIAVVDGAAPWDASTPLDAGDELATLDSATPPPDAGPPPLKCVLWEGSCSSPTPIECCLSSPCECCNQAYPGCL